MSETNEVNGATQDVTSWSMLSILYPRTVIGNANVIHMPLSPMREN